MSKQEERSCQVSPEETKESNITEITKDGSFNRQNNRFTTPFGTGQGELPIEAGRYRLIWSAACPWAHRQVIVRSILGLDEVISLGAVSPLRPRLSHVDWAFSLDKDEVDPVLKVKYLGEMYRKTDPEYTGRPTVPAVIDVKSNEVVNNDYFKLSNYFEREWKPLHKKNAPNLYPDNLQTEIDELNDVIFHDINNGVYKCGFAQSQESYEQAYEALFSRLDELEERLSQQRFLHGDYITDSDVRLYTTLARFDAAYYSAFRTNRNLLREYSHLWAYARDLYQTHGFGNTTDFDAIKQHYHMSITINPEKEEVKILPKGPDESVWETPHNRDKLSGKSEKFLIE